MNTIILSDLEITINTKKQLTEEQCRKAAIILLRDVHWSRHFLNRIIRSLELRLEQDALWKTEFPDVPMTVDGSNVYRKYD